MATAYEEQYDSSEYCTATSSEDESDDDNNVQYVTPRIFVNESAEKESGTVKFVDDQLKESFERQGIHYDADKMGSINKQSGRVRLGQLPSGGGGGGGAGNGLRGNQAAQGVKIAPSVLRKMQRGTVLAANDSERDQNPEEFARLNGHFNDEGYEYVAGEFEEPDYTGRTMKQIECYRKNLTFLNRIRPRNYRGKTKARSAVGVAYLEVAHEIPDNPKYTEQQNQRYRANKARLIAIKRQCEKDEETRDELIRRGESIQQEVWKKPKMEVETIDVNQIGKKSDDKLDSVPVKEVPPTQTDVNNNEQLEKEEEVAVINEPTGHVESVPEDGIVLQPHRFAESTMEVYPSGDEMNVPTEQSPQHVESPPQPESNSIEPQPKTASPSFDKEKEEQYTKAYNNLAAALDEFRQQSSPTDDPCLYPHNKHSPSNPSSPALLSSPSESDEPDDYLGDTEISDQGSDDLSTRKRSPIKRRKKSAQNSAENTQPAAQTQASSSSSPLPPPKHYTIYDSQVTDTRVTGFEASNFKVMAGPEYNQLYQDYIRRMKEESPSPSESENSVVEMQHQTLDTNHATYQPEVIDEVEESTAGTGTSIEAHKETVDDNQSQLSQSLSESEVSVVELNTKDANNEVAIESTTEELRAVEAIENAIVDDEVVAKEKEEKANGTPHVESQPETNEVTQQSQTQPVKTTSNDHFDTKSDDDEELDLSGRYRYPSAESYTKDYEETSFAVESKDKGDAKLSNDEVLTLAELDGAFEDDTVFDSTNAASSDVTKIKDATLSPTDVFDNDIASPNENKSFFDDESVVSDDGSIDTLIDNNDLNSTLNSSFRSEINVPYSPPPSAMSTMSTVTHRSELFIPIGSLKRQNRRITERRSITTFDWSRGGRDMNNKSRATTDPLHVPISPVEPLKSPEVLNDSTIDESVLNETGFSRSSSPNQSMLNQGAVKERSKSDVLEQNHLAAASNKPRSESYPPTRGGGVESEQAQNYRFKNALRVKGKFATEWKRLSCNGVFEYAGLSEFNEPHFKRIVQGKAIYLSLWGKPGKKKWRIGPDVASKVCWCYTKKRSADFGIPASGWYQSAGDKWEPIDLKISVIT